MVYKESFFLRPPLMSRVAYTVRNVYFTTLPGTNSLWVTVVGNMTGEVGSIRICRTTDTATAVQSRQPRPLRRGGRNIGATYREGRRITRHGLYHTANHLRKQCLSSRRGRSDCIAISGSQALCSTIDRREGRPGGGR